MKRKTQLTLILLFFFFLAFSSNALALTKVSNIKISGSFDIVKKDYKIGEIVRGKFTFFNQERDMTVDIKRWNYAGKLVTVKKLVKLKKGGRITVPVEWRVEKSGKQIIQYSVDGTWPSGKGLRGFGKVFNYTLNIGKTQPPQPKPAIKFMEFHATPSQQLTPSSGVVKNLGSILDCKQEPGCLIKYNTTFDEYLDSCKPAAGVTYIGLEGAYGFVRSFEIKGMNNSKCVIRFGLATSPDQSFLGKEMTCRLDPGKYAEQLGSLKQCTGPLSDALRSWNPPTK